MFEGVVDDTLLLNCGGHDLSLDGFIHLPAFISRFLSFGLDLLKSRGALNL